MFVFVKSNAFTRHMPPGAQIVNVLLGLWVILSPFILGFSRNSAALWNDIVAGIALVLVALLSGAINGALGELVVPIGVWMFAAPFIIGFPPAAFAANNVIMALVTIAAAAISDALRPVEMGTSSS